MSHEAPPWGAIVGVMPLKVIGPPVTIVIVPITTPELSAFGVATIVTFWGVLLLGLIVCAGVIAVGTVSGAMYTATLGLLVSGAMMPQVGLTVGGSGSVVVTPLVVVGM